MRTASRKRHIPAWLPKQQPATEIRFAQKIHGWFQEGVSLQGHGRFEEAFGIYQRVAREFERAKIQDASIHAAIGHVLLFLNDYKASLASSLKALEIDSSYLKALINASAACRQMSKLDDAYVYAERAHQLDPEDPKALATLAVILLNKNKVSQALVRAAYALHISPNNLDAIAAVASAYGRIGDMDISLPYYDKYVEQMPYDPDISSNRLFTLHYKPGITCEELKTAHKEWGDRFCGKLKRHWPEHQNERTTDRRLRIGYISGDFRHHVVGYWTKHVVEHHDRSRFEIFCFANNAEDSYSQQFKAAADHWIPIREMNDAEAAKTIQDHKIDILVDLSGHTHGHRLFVMARKPAPVQATWCGYIETTGLEAIDYAITDEITAPSSEPSPYVERPLRLRNGSVCFDQVPGVPEVGPLPFKRNGFFTFGCFNNPSKISPEVAGVWSEILQRAPGSRLLLAYGNLSDAFTRERIVKMFHALGIGEDRLQLRTGSRDAALRGYTEEVDLALDTFPYTGGTTTCEALWMGVPVIALYGDFPMSRFSCSLLAHAGLPGLTTNSKAEYIDRALHLSQDIETLAHLRANLRPHLMKTPLFNTRMFLDGLEEAYINIFEEWCRS